MTQGRKENDDRPNKKRPERSNRKSDDKPANQNIFVASAHYGPAESDSMKELSMVLNISEEEFIHEEI